VLPLFEDVREREPDLLTNVVLTDVVF